MSAGVLAGVVALCLSGAFVPWVSAELVVGGAAAVLDRAWLPVLVLAASAAQMTGKAALYALARWAPERLPARARSAMARVGDRLAGRRGGTAAVLVASSAFGAPPFYLTTLASGLLGVSFPLFLAAGAAGTLARTSTVAWIGHAAASPLVGWLAPQALTAQAPTAPVEPKSVAAGLRVPPLTGLAARCGAGAPEVDAVAVRVAEALAALAAHGADAPHQAEAHRARLASVLDSLEHAIGVAAAGTTAAAYQDAVVLGGRVETLAGRDRIGAAERLYVEASALLERDPDHAGAHHLLGRLHAAVMRTGGTTRFLAKLLLGGDLLSSASWRRAIDHLSAAERGSPCFPEHHFELARALVETGRYDEARAEIDHVLTLTGGAPAHAASALRMRYLRARALDLAGAGG